MSDKTETIEIDLDDKSLQRIINGGYCDVIIEKGEIKGLIATDKFSEIVDPHLKKEKK